MATIKLCSDLQQSRILAKILPLESADMMWTYDFTVDDINGINVISETLKLEEKDVPAWSLAALLKYLSEIKPQVYTSVLFPSESKWILQFAEYGHGNVCEVSCNNPIDACVTMIEKLKELNLL